ncbi:DUF2388 domain-containing protein [Pseudomonas nitroreducens]|uniref:DUF2388 domain-containing protein n=1 Tax=Pseudomonas nitroreducens TaxID=46680 RepID=A0A5R9A7R4_PSENT|nr:DUF2388 domain-containing protein [Pseudomonas nitroreducens]
MKRTAAALLLAASGPATAMDGKGNSCDHFTVGSSLGTAAVSESSSQAPRAYQQARDDALAYVASAGQVHGAQLEQALRLYRSEHPQSPLSDLQVAQAIASRG